MKGEFFSVELIMKNYQPYLKFLGRYEDKTKLDISVKGHSPYFFILDEEEKLVDFFCEKAYWYKSIYGDKLIKIIVSNPFDIKELTKKFSKTFEGDIVYPTRFLIDNQINTSIEVNGDSIKKCDVSVEPRILYVDIETEYYGGSNKEMLLPIISIAMYDNYENKFYVISFNHNTSLSNKTITRFSELLKENITLEYLQVKDEKELLSKFIELVKKNDIDIFTGWNVDFDMIYILRRLEINGMNARELSPVGKYYYRNEFFNKNKESKFHSKVEKLAMIRGRAIVDILKGYRRIKWQAIESFRLDDIGKSEFNIGKLEYDGWIGDFWKNDYEKFLEYNIRDIEICLALDRKYSVINTLLNLRRISGCEISDIHFNSRMIDVYILRECNNKFILPSRVYRSDEDNVEMEGGFVLEPKVGLFENVAVFDLKSLYPNIMLSFNMSPETKNNEVGKIVVGNGVKFIDKEGITKNILSNLIKKRDDIRDLLENEEVVKDNLKFLNLYKRQYALKTFVNSLYGVLKYQSFRLYDVDIAKSITYVGRFLTKKIQEFCESKGYTVLRADSVTGDRYTVILDTKQNIRIVSFEELWNMTDRKNKRKDGKEIGYFRFPIYTLSENLVKKKSEWQKINFVVRHETNKKIFRLYNAYGETHVTEDHSCFNNEGRLQKSKELDSFYLLKNVPKIKYKKKIKLSDYSDYLSCEDKYKIQNEYDVNSKEFKALLEFLGAYISEGSCSFNETSKKYRRVRVIPKSGQIQIGNQNKNFLLKAQKNIRLISNAKANITGGNVIRYRPEKKKKYCRRTFKLRISGKKLPKLFRDLCGFKSSKKHLPEFFFNLPLNIQDYCLNIMIDGDGSRFRGNLIKYTSKSHQLISEMSFIFKQKSLFFDIGHDDRNNKACHTIRQTKTGERFLLRYGKIKREELNGYKYIYDINTEKNHNFYDMLGGVLLHNTDSSFVHFGNVDKDKAIELGRDLEENINLEFVKWFIENNNDTSYFSIKFEKLYGLMYSGEEKKLYGGKIIWDWKKGYISEVEIKGFATRRSDRSKFSRRIQRELFELIFEKVENEKIVNFIKKEILNLFNMKYSFEDISIPKGITKDINEYAIDNPWIRGVKFSEKNIRGFEFSPKPKLLYVKKVGEIHTDVMCFNNEKEVPGSIVIDWDRMIDASVIKVCEKILFLLKINTEEINIFYKNLVNGQTELYKYGINLNIE